MDKMRLGRTNLLVSRSGFGAIPIQRLSFPEAIALLRQAFDGGITFFDTARGYTDSEEKIGQALGEMRQEVILASKTHAATAAALFKDLETSLTNLKTDYLDIYQLHNPSSLPEAQGELYQAALEAKKQGKIRFISITSHRLDLALEEVRSGLFDTMQFPLSVLSSDEDLELVKLCAELDVGFIAMKAMSGGLITDPTATFSFLRSLGNVVPIWGIQHSWELEQFLELEANPPAMDEKLEAMILHDRQELQGSFCRSCGYCVPTCPAKIPIAQAARMSLLLRRMNPERFITPQGQADMEKIKDCIECGICKTHCPYELDTPALLKREYAFFKAFLAERGL
ncbi:MAG: aldo/keto reductase [Symbiobacteriaceae bacterium]|nr:aldo/keto reductase [Symbiobacteriaceae bacterium]